GKVSYTKQISKKEKKNFDGSRKKTTIIRYGILSFSGCEGINTTKIPSDVRALVVDAAAPATGWVCSLIAIGKSLFQGCDVKNDLICDYYPTNIPVCAA
ncbi:hypothetical protein, partial [Escherichia coli]|uniref:hypothetical protein n=1 Tax=Escherichia coli TaxID=562 RepID=UPI001BC8ACF6